MKGSPSSVTKLDFAEWFLEVIHKLIRVLSVCTIAPCAALYSIPSVNERVLDTITDLRQGLSVDMDICDVDMLAVCLHFLLLSDTL